MMILKTAAIGYYSSRSKISVSLPEGNISNFGLSERKLFGRMALLDILGIVNDMGSKEVPESPPLPCHSLNKAEVVKDGESKNTMPRKNGPWTINETIPKYKNPWIEVTEDQVIQPDGKPGIFSVVKLKHGSAILPIDEEGFVYLAEQFRYILGKNSFEAACGAIGEGETPLRAAQRELKEELGILAEEWVDLGMVNPFY